MTISQRTVVEVPFNLPNGLQNHPAIVLSTDYSNEEDETIIVVMITNNKNEDDFTFRLSPQMFSGNNPPTSYQARLHLISLFSIEKDIISNSHPNVMMKEEHFHRMMERIIRITFGYKFPVR